MMGGGSHGRFLHTHSLSSSLKEMNGWTEGEENRGRDKGSVWLLQLFIGGPLPPSSSSLSTCLLHFYQYNFS